jgi:NTP pyrophosphatase (non-canonical NTP hydrolase)
MPVYNDKNRPSPSQLKLLTPDFVPKPEVNLTDLANEIYEWAVGKGFYDKIEDEDLYLAADLLESVSIDTADLEVARKGTPHYGLTIYAHELTNEQLRCAMALMLIVTEIPEVMEAVLNGDAEHEAEEVADTMIRLLDYAGYRGMDIHGAVERKMEINRGRPYRHGKKF